MNLKFIGTGAAGNKAVIRLLESEKITEEKMLLLNSTMSDIPNEYRKYAIEYSDTLGGCGKERNLAKKLSLSALESNKLARLDQFIDPTDDYIAVVTSTEGGTGSGSAIIIAKYIYQVIGKKVMIFAFNGFEEDGRGLQNTIEFFQDLEPEYMVQVISNKKFLENGNKPRAEKAANEEFVKRVSILLTEGVVDSEQNIDHTDMLKVSTTPGYMTINYSELNIKNVDGFNKTVTDMIDNDKSVDISEKSQKRLAVFLNIKPSTEDFIDYNYSVIKDRYGIPYEVFSNIQYNEELPESISMISSGLKMPLDEIKDIYKKYKEHSEKVNKSKDDFFAFANQLKGNSEDSMFNLNIDEKENFGKSSKDDFFNNFKNKPTQKEETEEVAKSKDDFLKENY